MLGSRSPLMADLGTVSHAIVQGLNPYLNITAFCLSCLDWDYTSFGPLKGGHWGDCCAQCVLALNMCSGGGWEVLLFCTQGFSHYPWINRPQAFEFTWRPKWLARKSFLLSFPLQRGGHKNRILSQGLIPLLCFFVREIYKRNQRMQDFWCPIPWWISLFDT